MKIREVINNVRPSNIVWHIEDGFIGLAVLTAKVAVAISDEAKDFAHRTRVEYKARQLFNASQINTSGEAAERAEIRARLDELLAQRNKQASDPRAVGYHVRARRARGVAEPRPATRTVDDESIHSTYSDGNGLVSHVVR